MVYLQLLLRRPLVSPLAVVARPWCHNPLVDIVRAASLVTALGLNRKILLASCPLSSRIDFFFNLPVGPKGSRGDDYPLTFLDHHREGDQLSISINL